MRMLLFGLILAIPTEAVSGDINPIVTGPDGLGHVVEKMANGDVTFDTFQMKPTILGTEVKTVDKSGHITQWYQSFYDEKAHDVLQLIRKSPGDRPSYGGIEEVFVRTYNSNGNEAEMYEYAGNGIMKDHAIDIYSWLGNWTRADHYDANGSLTGSTFIPPEAYLYGEQKK